MCVCDDVILGDAQQAHLWCVPGVRPLPAGPRLRHRCGWASGRTSACGSDSQHFPCSKCRREESHNISLRFFDNKHLHVHWNPTNMLREVMPLQKQTKIFPCIAFNQRPWSTFPQDTHTHTFATHTLLLI